MVTHQAASRLIRALVTPQRTEGTYVHPSDIEAALHIYWRMANQPKVVRGWVESIPILSALSSSLALPDRWNKVDKILAMAQTHLLPRTRTPSDKRSDLTRVDVVFFRSRSHARAVRLVLGGPKTRIEKLFRRATRLRFANAPFMPFDVFLDFVQKYEAAGHHLDSELVAAYVGSIAHSLLQLETPWERRELERLSLSLYDIQKDAFNALERVQSFVEQRKDEKLADKDFYTTLLQAFNMTRRQSRHATVCWMELLKRPPVPGLALDYALDAAYTPVDSQRVWDAYCKCTKPSKRAWTAWTRKLCKLGLHAQAADLILRHIGDTPHNMYPAVWLFTSVDDPEPYAKMLPNLWAYPRVQAAVAARKAQRELLKTAQDHS